MANKSILAWSSARRPEGQERRTTTLPLQKKFSLHFLLFALILFSHSGEPGVEYHNSLRNNKAPFMGSDRNKYALRITKKVDCLRTVVNSPPQRLLRRFLFNRKPKGSLER